MSAMLSDVHFYIQCPHFVWLRETAIASFEMHKERCSDCNSYKYVAHIFDAFFKNVKDLHAIDPALLDPIKQYLQVRKKRPIGKVVIMYRDTQKQALKFVF
jgi:hypothetical protein